MDEDFINGFANTFDYPPENLVTVLTKFGPLPKKGQRELLLYLLHALNKYRFQTLAQKISTPAKERDQLVTVQTSARRLLTHLGLNAKRIAPRFRSDIASDRSSWERLRTLGRPNGEGMAALMRLVGAGIDHKGKSENEVNAELAAVRDQVADAVISVLWLYERATTAADKIEVAAGHGGTRNVPTAVGQLQRDAMTVYDHFRRQFPESGPAPAQGGPLYRFVCMVVTLAGAPRLSDEAIRNVFREWRGSVKSN